MSSAARRRRTVQEEEYSSEEETGRSAQRNRRHAAQSEDDEGEEEEEGEEDEARDDEMDIDANGGQDRTVKKMVRYALACEYQRIPIRRTGISEKVIGKQRGSFKRVFEAAQNELRTKFGMEMVELPTKEKTTMKDKRAAQKSKGGGKVTSSYILTTILPSKYRTSNIIPPSIIGTVDNEAAYVAIYSVIVTIIALSPGGMIADTKLRQHLTKMNIEQNVAGLGKTEELLKKMCGQGYVHKIVEKTADEETIDWRVGPRGRVEIASKGVRGLVLEVYGENAPVDLDKRIQRNLGMEIRTPDTANTSDVRQDDREEGEYAENGDVGSSNRRASGRRR